MKDHIFWLSSRSSGIIAWIILSLSIIWGLLLSTKTMKKAIKRPWLLGVHQTLGALATIFLLVHMIVLLFDKYTDWTYVDLIIPFTSTWHPVYTAWGVVASWMLIAVEITSLAKKHLSKNIWHKFHMLSFPLWVFATIHAYLSGPDVQTMINIGLGIFIAVPILILSVLRLILWINEPLNTKRY